MILISTILFLVVVWSKIPDKIPLHYNFAGNVDRWGSKSEIIILPIISWILYILLIVSEKFPQTWNTGVKVTEENKERVYSTSLHLMSTIKFICVCVFTYLTVQIALSLGLSIWFLPIFLLILFGDILYWTYKLFKAR
ncbi:MAG TPA: DUF1648 domain-containing protein [Clostridium sp.]|nr:DUF1648 domain-containing protein [Clostridium sp.]